MMRTRANLAPAGQRAFNPSSFARISGDSRVSDLRHNAACRSPDPSLECPCTVRSSPAASKKAGCEHASV